MAERIEVCLTPKEESVVAYLQRHQLWCERMLGCHLSQAVLVQIDDLDLATLVVPRLLAGVPFDTDGAARSPSQTVPPGGFHVHWVLGSITEDQMPFTVDEGSGYIGQASTIDSLVDRWEMPPGAMASLRLEPSLNRRTDGTAAAGEAWMATWIETPLAVWFRGLRSAVLVLTIPLVSHEGGGATDESPTYLVLARDDAPAALALLRGVFRARPKVLHVIGGTDVRLADQDDRWDRLVLSPDLARQVKDDFETFLARELWYRANRLPYRRGYLKTIPPGGSQNLSPT